MLEGDIENFISWIRTENGSSYNTEVSYRRDLQKMAAFFEAIGKTDAACITQADLEHYLVYMEKEEFAPTTISRNAVSIRAFFHYLQGEGRVETDPSAGLKAPKVKKKVIQALEQKEIEILLAQPSDETVKGIRDRAMLELLNATGMKVSELVHLKWRDVNLEYGFVCCNEAGHERVLPLSPKCRKALEVYLREARSRLIREPEEESLFISCLGLPMSRQGFWKMLKAYAKDAGITKDITPQTLRRAFADNMLRSGANYRKVQEMLGNNCY